MTTDILGRVDSRSSLYSRPCIAQLRIRVTSSSRTTEGIFGMESSQAGLGRSSQIVRRDARVFALLYYQRE